MGQRRLGLNLQAATVTALNFPGVAGELSPRDEAAINALVEDVGIDVSLLVAEAAGLEGDAMMPPIAQLSRAEWLTVTVAGMAGLFSPILESVARGPASRTTRAMVSVQLGGLLGYMSKRVLGHYDWPLVPTGGGEPPIYILGQNILAVSSRLHLRADELLVWLLAHELTHSAQFRKAAWLGDYLRGLVDEQLEAVRDILDGSAERGTGSVALRLLVDRFRSGTGNAALAKTQALMAVVEGHADLVMSRIGREVTPGATGLAALMGRVEDPQRSWSKRFLDRALGLELKLDQYRLGRGFFAVVYREGGSAAVDKVWQAPVYLPDVTELAEPLLWLRRVS